MKKWSRHLLAAGALALGMSAAHADDNNTLYFYNWTEYVPPGQVNSTEHSCIFWHFLNLPFRCWLVHHLTYKLFLKAVLRQSCVTKTILR